MKLIGMIDSPYVRRVAVSLNMLGLVFEHLPISVFSGFDTVKAINPVVKVPTLITDDAVLMDSSLILEYAERLALAGHTLVPEDLKTYTQAQRIIGIALAACEKAVQAVYELNLRPAEKQHQPWLDRVYVQLEAALNLLEQEVKSTDFWLFGSKMLQADITTAIAFRFAYAKLPNRIRASDYPALTAFSARAEATNAFLAYPYPAE